MFFFCIFDISQGYHHIDSDDNYRKYLGFSWKIDDKISYFMLIVLPFSLSSGPFIFTKVMRSNFSRKEGIKNLHIY